MENPFQDYGKIVKGTRFIGRSKEIKIIHNRVLYSAFGNIAIQGVNRIGKSSLAWNALLVNKKSLEEEGCIFVIRINTSHISNSIDFFGKLIKELYRRIKRNSKIDTSDFIRLFNEFIEAKNTIDKYDAIEEFYLILRESNFRVIYVLDEFDAVRNYLNVGDFQFLRELTYNPDTEICLVTLSRRSIKELEPLGGTLSNFYQTFDDLYLGMFTKEDLKEYWESFFTENLELSEIAKNEIVNIAGHHPFLLDLFNFHLFNNLSSDIHNDILETKNKIRLTILNNYQTILGLLEEENLHLKLLQVIVGPVIDITREEVEKLERYDLIKLSNEKKIEVRDVELEAFEAFSPDFEQYLKLKNREIPIWDLWSETEIKLREIVQVWLVERFGENWVSKFRKLNKKELYIAKLEAMQAREKKSFSDTYSQNLLDFTYPAELFNNFMSVEWKWFKEIFSGQKNDWKLKFDLLARIRNPLAHNKENLLKDFERDRAKGYCKEIIKRIKDWEQDLN